MQTTLLLTFIAVDKRNISFMARRKRQFKRKGTARKKRKTKRGRRRKSHNKKNGIFRKRFVKTIYAK